LQTIRFPEAKKYRRQHLMVVANMDEFRKQAVQAVIAEYIQKLQEKKYPRFRE